MNIVPTNTFANTQSLLQTTSIVSRLLFSESGKKNGEIKSKQTIIHALR